MRGFNPKSSQSTLEMDMGLTMSSLASLLALLPGFLLILSLTFLISLGVLTDLVRGFLGPKRADPVSLSLLEALNTVALLMAGLRICQTPVRL